MYEMCLFTSSGGHLFEARIPYQLDNYFERIIIVECVNSDTVTNRIRFIG